MVAPRESNWTVGEAPFVGGAPAVLAIFMVAGFSFQGTEMIGVAAGESENPPPRRARALTSVFWRIMLFYIGAMVVIGFLIPYSGRTCLPQRTATSTSPRSPSSSSVRASPSRQPS